MFRDLKLSPLFNLLLKHSQGPPEPPPAERLAGLLALFPLAANLLPLPLRQQLPLLLLPRAPRPAPLLLPRPRRRLPLRVPLLRRLHLLRVHLLRRQRLLPVRVRLFKALVRRLLLPSLFSTISLDVRLLRRGISSRSPEPTGFLKMDFW
jgi:hypothetical protein